MGLKCECNYVNLLTKRNISGCKFKGVAHAVHIAVKISVLIVGEKDGDQCAGVIFLQGNDESVFVMVNYLHVAQV